MVSFILRKKRSDSLLPNTPVGDTFFELTSFLVEWWGEVQGYVCKQEWLLFFCLGSIPRLGRSHGGGNGNLLQYSCLGNPVERGARWAYSTWGHRKVRHNLATKQQHERKKGLFWRALQARPRIKAILGSYSPGCSQTNSISITREFVIKEKKNERSYRNYKE